MEATQQTSLKNARFNPTVVLEFELAFKDRRKDGSDFLTALRQVDKRFPWRDRNGKSREGIRSIKSKFVDASPDFPYRFEISFEPSEIQLTRGQLVAFYNYALNLANVLAFMKIRDAEIVNVKVDLMGVFTSFKAS